MTDKHISNDADIATPKLIEKHEVAMGEYLRGETVGHEDIDWDDDKLSENDLCHIRLGEQELATNAHGNWANIKRNLSTKMFLLGKVNKKHLG